MHKKAPRNCCFSALLSLCVHPQKFIFYWTVIPSSSVLFWYSQLFKFSELSPNVNLYVGWLAWYVHTARSDAILSHIYLCVDLWSFRNYQQRSLQSLFWIIKEKVLKNTKNTKTLIPSIWILPQGPQGCQMKSHYPPQHDGVKTTNKKSHTQNSFKIHF